MLQNFIKMAGYDAIPSAYNTGSGEAEAEGFLQIPGHLKSYNSVWATPWDPVSKHQK